MKVSQLRAATLEWASLLGEDDGTPEKRAIVSFVELLQEHESKTAAVIANKIRALSVPTQGEHGYGHGVVRISTLVRQLEGLSRFCNHIKATAASKGFGAVATALRPHGVMSVDDFVAAAKTGLATRGKSRPRARVTVDPSLISSYVAKLQNTTDETQLGRVVEALKGDGAVSKDALSQIVNAVSGHVGSFSSKQAAHEELQVALIEQARFRNKLKQ